MMANRTRYEISPDHKPAKCKYCQATIYFVKTDKGGNMPCDADGYSHFNTCPNANEASGKGRKAEAAAKGELVDELDKVLTMFDDMARTVEERHEKLRAWATKIEGRFTKMQEWAQQLEDRIKKLEGKQ